MTAVALLGTGRMGSAMARALAGAGHELVLWNRTPDRADALAVELGARTAATPAEAARSAAVALTVLADDAAVEAVFGGPDGLLAGANPGSVLADLSTITPTTLAAFERDAHARGVYLLDAPVSGSVAAAESGQLTLMVGGEAEHLEQARPVLDTIGRTIFHIGPLGSGHAMKLAVNTLIFGLNEALAEGLVLAEAAGVERSRAWEVFAASAAGAPFVGYKRAAFLDPAGTPTAFALELADKDLRLITAFADELGVPMPQARINLDVIRDAEASRDPGDDFSAVAEHLRSNRLGTRPTRQAAR